MSNITDWIKYELYPALYERIAEAFPEHNFERTAKDWRSNTYLDGSPHKRADKTKVDAKYPGTVYEQGGEYKSLIDYVMERDSLDFLPAVKKLAGIAGVQLPVDQSYSPEAYRASQEALNILGAAKDYFAYLLSQKDGEAVMKYLQGRGYTPAEVEEMELGYIASPERLNNYLEGKRYAQEDIDKALQIDGYKGLGETHSLVIPYRSGGTVKGFKFRSITGAEPKYLNSRNLPRNEGFFNLSPLRGAKDLIVVEGELDALHATVKGIENVVATGGSSISQEQIEDAKRRGAKAITLCFDKEPGVENKILKALDVLEKDADLRVYVAELPARDGEKVDPDRLLKERGVEALREALDQADPHYIYRLNHIREKYAKIQTDQGELTAKDIHALLEEVVVASSRLSKPLERDQFTKAFLGIQGLKDLGIKEDSLKDTADKIRYKKEEAEQERRISRVLVQAQKKREQGDTKGVIELLESGLKEERVKKGAGLIQPYSYQDWEREIASAPQAIKTGYPSLDEIAGLPAGAITLIAGRPSHGKTTLMFNLLLRMAEIHGDKGLKFYFFSYEEQRRYILTKILNSLIAEDLVKHFPRGIYTNYHFLRDYLAKGKEDLHQVEAGKATLKRLLDEDRIAVIDQSHTVEELGNVLEALNRKENIGAVFIDYIQRMSTERRTQDKRTEIAHISDQVLQIAKRTGLSMVLGAQLNRATTIGEPRMENLKEAGNLEEDANLVYSVYNEAKERQQVGDGEAPGREVELQIKALKNRDGEVNREAVLIFDTWTGKIKDSKEDLIDF